MLNTSSMPNAQPAVGNLVGSQLCGQLNSGPLLNTCLWLSDSVGNNQDVVSLYKVQAGTCYVTHLNTVAPLPVHIVSTNTFMWSVPTVICYSIHAMIFACPCI